MGSSSHSFPHSKVYTNIRSGGGVAAASDLLIIVLLDLCLAGGRSAAAADSWWWRWGGGGGDEGRDWAGLYLASTVCIVFASAFWRATLGLQLC